MIAPWREIPFDGVPHLGTHGMPFGFDVTFGAQESAFVVRTMEPPPLAVAPEALARLVPTSLAERWNLLEFVDDVWWHDWLGNRWRRVGCGKVKSDLQVRPTALMALKYEGGQSQLQSWPLPPRDPKPHALAIVALCMAGTWWVCAWRYRRRMRLAAVGAV